MTRRPSNACEEVLRALTPSSGDTRPSSSSSSPVASFLSSALSQIQQSGPSSRSLLSISSGCGEQEEPPISPLLVGAGKLLLENWQPILQAGKAVASARGGSTAVGGSSGLAPIAAAGAGLVIAGVAKIGMSLLERRLQRRSGAARPDPLRGVSSKSKAKTKNRKSSSTTSSAHAPSDHHNMHQLSTLFPNLDSNILASALVVTNGNLDEAVEEILAQSTDLPTPGATSKPAKLTTSILTPSSSSPLPPCPECPVCLSSLKGCRIYQCQQGHSLCHQCKNNSQVRCCPTCRGKLTGRATNMEQLLASIYGN